MKEAKKVETSNLKIEKNAITLGKILLQISNISQVSIEPIPKKEFKASAIIVLILGILGMMQWDENIKALGAIAIFIVIGYIIWIVVENSKEGKYLYIYMNSGNFYYIFCERERFLQDAMKVIECCINNHNMQEINIDFKNCQLYNSPFSLGNTNSPVIVGNNNSVTINEADWVMIQDELIKVYQKLPQNSDEYNASRKALNYVINRDEKGFKNTLKEFAKSFTSDLFSGVASGVLVELISKFIV